MLALRGSGVMKNRKEADHEIHEVNEVSLCMGGCGNSVRGVGLWWWKLQSNADSAGVGAVAGIKETATPGRAVAVTLLENPRELTKRVISVVRVFD